MGKLKELQQKIKTQKLNNYGEYLKDSDNLKLELSHLILEARIYSGLSQEELAELIGTKQSSIARAESGSYYSGFNLLKKIADALNTYLIPPKFGFMAEENSSVDVSGHNKLSVNYTEKATGSTDASIKNNHQDGKVSLYSVSFDFGVTSSGTF